MNIFKLNKLFITFILFFTTLTISSQANYLDEILKLETKLSKEKFLDIIINLPFSKKTSNINKFLILIKKAEKIAENQSDKKILALTYKDVAMAYHYTGDYDVASSYTIKSANLFNEINDYKNYGSAYVNLGWRINNTNLKKGLAYMLKGIKILEKYDDKYSLRINEAYNNYGVLKQKNNEKDSALYYHNKSIEICLHNNDSTGLPYALVHKAEVLRDRKQFKEAKELIDKAMLIRKKINDIYGITDSYEHLGNYYFAKKEYKKAIEACKKAYEMSKKYSFFYVSKSTTEKMYKSYVALNDYKKAFEMYQLNTAILDSLKGVKISSKVSQLEIQFDTAEKEKQLLKTKAEKATTELKLNNQKQLTYGLVGGLALLLLGGYSLVQRNKRKHQLAIAQEKEAGLQAIIQAEENERSKIARELHDGVVQQIGSVILNSRNILDKMNLLDKPESKELLKSLEDSNQDIRNISHQMMPRALEELGLISALDDLLKASLPLKGIKVNYEHFNITERLPQKIEKTLYRIVQELTNNILKHSQATEVSVQLFKAQNNIMLIVEDNGVGMKPQKSKGIGLLNINSRLDMVNGSVNFEPSPESGTLVTVKIPL